MNNRFLRWLSGLTLILRCFVIALLFHATLLITLGLVKVGGQVAERIVAAFDAPPPPISNEDQDPFRAYRDTDYDPPGVRGMPPSNGMKIEVAMAGQPSLINELSEVIGIVDNSAMGARAQGTGAGRL